MGSLAAALVLLTLQMQSEPIGELSKEEFSSLLGGMGYSSAWLPDPYQVRLSDGSTTFPIVVSFGRNPESQETFILSATGRMEFDLPRTLGKKQLQDWGTNAKLEKIQLSSFLGGRVVLQGHLANPKTTAAELKAGVERMIAAIKILNRELTPLGGKASSKVYEIGMGPLEPDLRLDYVEAEDLDYLRVRLGWGNKVSPGGGKGWFAGAEPLGIPVVFNGMWGRNEKISLTCMGTPNPTKAERYMRNPVPISWATGSITLESVYIQSWIDTSKGITVRDLTARILDFARRMKALDVL